MDAARRRFGANKTVFIENSGVHIDLDFRTRTNKIQQKSKCTKIDSVILSFHFFKNCDVTVISSSGFGFFASGLMRNTSQTIMLSGN